MAAWSRHCCCFWVRKPGHGGLRAGCGFSGPMPMTTRLGSEWHTEDETQHEVVLTQPFYIGVFEVTQKQWERVMGTWPMSRPGE